MMFMRIHKCVSELHNNFGVNALQYLVFSLKKATSASFSVRDCEISILMHHWGIFLKIWLVQGVCICLRVNFGQSNICEF
eukprot:c36869_g1_i1 orf=1-240(+)